MFSDLTSFKHFGSWTCSHIHIQSHDTYGQRKAGDWIWTCRHVKAPKCWKLVKYFWFYSASTKSSFGFCSCSELFHLKLGRKKNFAGKCKLLIQDSYRDYANNRYLPYQQLCGKASMWICMYSQKWPKMGGENCRVLRLRWMHKLAMYQVTFQFRWYFSFSDISVLVTF